MAEVPIPNISTAISAFYLGNMSVLPCFNKPCSQSCSAAPTILRLSSELRSFLSPGFFSGSVKRQETENPHGAGETDTTLETFSHKHSEKIVTLLTAQLSLKESCCVFANLVRSLCFPQVFQCKNL